MFLLEGLSALDEGGMSLNHKLVAIGILQIILFGITRHMVP
jgi:hypothetical protein